MKTVKRERESMDGDNEESERSAWMETAKGERKCMNGDSEESYGVHGWRQ